MRRLTELDLRVLCAQFRAVNHDAAMWSVCAGTDTDTWESPDCDVMSRAFLDWLAGRGITGQLVKVCDPTPMVGDHWFAVVDGIAVDWTGRQFYNVPQPPIDPYTIEVPLLFAWPGDYPLGFVDLTACTCDRP